jgi:hypothetical protein
MVAGFLEEQLYRWLRAAELTCDRAALLVVQDPKVVISVLMKLAGGCPSLADQLNVDAFLEQARSYDKAASNPVGWYIRSAKQTSSYSSCCFNLLLLLGEINLVFVICICVCGAGTLRRESCRILCR